MKFDSLARGPVEASLGVLNGHVGGSSEDDFMPWSWLKRYLIAPLVLLGLVSVANSAILEVRTSSGLALSPAGGRAECQYRKYGRAGGTMGCDRQGIGR